MPRAVVTGAFSNIGRAVAQRLLASGWDVATLTNREAPENSPIESFPLTFDQENLDRALAGCSLFITTYWVRFPRGEITFDTAVENSRRLIEAAERAGVKRFVQVSVSNASEDSPLGYYSGKARVDRYVRESSLSHAIVKPTLVLGPRDVLTGNIAWFLRKLPAIAVPRGDGYNIQPVTIDDCARVIVDAAYTEANVEVDAAGPDSMPFDEYVRLVRAAVGSRSAILRLPPWIMLASLRLFSFALRDTVLTREELLGLRDDMLVTHAPPLGTEHVSDWLAANAQVLGQHYTNDTRPRFKV